MELWVVKLRIPVFRASFLGWVVFLAIIAIVLSHGPNIFVFFQVSVSRFRFYTALLLINIANLFKAIKKKSRISSTYSNFVTFLKQKHIHATPPGYPPHFIIPVIFGFPPQYHLWNTIILYSFKELLSLSKVPKLHEIYKICSILLQAIVIYSHSTFIIFMILFFFLQKVKISDNQTVPLCLIGLV